MSWLKDYMDGRRKQVNPIESALPVPIRNTEDSVGDVGSVGATDKPVIDSNNAIGSLLDLMGPTPAERAERERRAVQNKSAMSAWAGLFDGLRHLGNLYYASKQATPQVYNNPYEQIERDVEANRKRMDDLENYRRQYNMQLYGLQRQGVQDAQAAEQHKAQMENYAANNELLKARVESERVRAEQQAALNKARQEQIEEKTRQLREKFPMEQEKLRQTIKKINHDAGRPYATGRSGTDPYEELATLLHDSPEVVGPILQNMGYGYYDESTGVFTETKPPSRTAAKWVNQQAGSRRGVSGGRPKTTGTNLSLDGATEQNNPKKPGTNLSLDGATR